MNTVKATWRAISSSAAEIKAALAKKHYMDFFLTEVKSGPTQLARPGELKILDGLAIKKSWTNPCFTGYEVKVSRGDFLRDAKFYTYEELVNCLYIVCPKGMIDRTELPESVGLMYYDPEKKTLTTRKKAIYREIEYTPEMLLYIIYSRLESDRYPFFSGKREYFEEYLRNKESNQRLGCQVKSKLVEENAKMKTELEQMGAFRQNYETYKQLQGVLRKHGIFGWRGGVAEELDVALSRRCPEDIHLISEDMERVAARLKKMVEIQDNKEDKTMTKTTIYRPVDGLHNTWQCGECGHLERFEADGPYENGWNLCPCCGAVIKKEEEQ